MTILDTARHPSVGWDVVRASRARPLATPCQAQAKGLRQIAIDEIAVGKGRRSLTVVLDLDSRKRPAPVRRIRAGQIETTV